MKQFLCRWISRNRSDIWVSRLLNLSEFCLQSWRIWRTSLSRAYSRWVAWFCSDSSRINDEFTWTICAETWNIWAFIFRAKHTLTYLRSHRDRLANWIGGAARRRSRASIWRWSLWSLWNEPRSDNRASVGFLLCLFFASNISASLDSFSSISSFHFGESFFCFFSLFVERFLKCIFDILKRSSKPSKAKFNLYSIFRFLIPSLLWIPRALAVPWLHSTCLDSLLVSDRNIGTSCAQKLHESHVDISRCMVQRCVAVRI